jgi:hypothetical protein
MTSTLDNSMAITFVDGIGFNQGEMFYFGSFSYIAALPILGRRPGAFANCSSLQELLAKARGDPGNNGG